MAGHSKWANIQHRKGRQDEKRGKLFTKAAKEIIIAAKSGPDPAANARLRAAIAAGKAVNLPKDKIEAAIRKGSGADGSAELFEINYEGYAPSGVAVIIETATDNKNRTVAEVRHILTKNGGSLGESGSVAWMFERKGIINLNKDKYSEDKAMELALEAGADDVHDEGDTWAIHTTFTDFNTVRDALEAANVEMEGAELAYIAANNLEINDQEVAEKLIKLIDMLEDYDDVQKVHANFDLSDDLVSKLGA